MAESHGSARVPRPARKVWTGPADPAAIERVCKRYGIRLLVLFGSHAQGRATERSDVDIAYLPEPRRRPNELRLYADLVTALGSGDLDLVRMDTAPPLLALGICEHGRVLFSRDANAWLQFSIRAVKQWDDVRRFQRLKVQAIDRYLANQGLTI